MSRKLASIMTVKEVADIPEKDKIGLVSFNETGWQVIGNKDLKSGDKVLYLEYDSIIPEKTLDLMDAKTAEMLKKRCWSAKRNGCLIKCLKMAGQVSYGILFEKKDLVRLFSLGEWEKFEPGTDLTDKLGITKKDDEIENTTVQEKPSFLRKWYNIVMWKVFRKKKRKVLGHWPDFISRTDETRVQALPPDTVEQFGGEQICVTEKIDGQSVTFAIYKNNFYVCSRNMVIYMKPIKKAKKELIPQNAHKQTDRYLASACKYDIASVMYKIKVNPMFHDFAIQAEQAGPGIQKNPLQLESVVLFVFNLFDIKLQRYCNIRLLKEMVDKFNKLAHPSATKLQTVPILLEEGVFFWKPIRELEELAKGNTFNGKNKNREGIVIRIYSDDEEFIAEPPRGCSNMASFKILNPDYLLNNKEDE